MGGGKIVPPIPVVTQVQNAYRVYKMANQVKGVVNKAQKIQRAIKFLKKIPSVDVNMNGEDKHLKNTPWFTIDLWGKTFGRNQKDRPIPPPKKGTKVYNPETGLWEKVE